MEFNQIVELIKAVSASELTTFKYEEGNQKILIEAGRAAANNVPEASAPAGRPAAGTVIRESAQPGESTVVVQNDISVANVAVEAPAGKLVKSPLVGRFYAAPSEDAEPFVRVGDTVKKGQTLAIVEAMKLMNEIESEYDGVVAEILVENAQSVEYGQVLFRLS